MGYYDELRDLPLTVEAVEYERLERETPKFTRATTVVSLVGPADEGDDPAVGRGEDVTYEAELHPIPDRFDLAGEYTLDSFASKLAELDLFPGATPNHDAFRNYRRWAFESAAFDLALRQAGTHLGEVLDREYDPVRFVASPSLGDPSRADPLRRWQERNPDLEFKLDVDGDWTADLVADLSDAGVRIADFKAHYEDEEVAGGADADLYRRVAEAFPEAVLEDPAWNDEAAAALDFARDRVSWDYPITGVESVRDLPFEPSWLNIKPSRFGSVESMLETVEHCEANGIRMYGGGQFELSVGRRQLHLLASLFYPDSPNDVAPTEYHAPEPPAELPRSPIAIGDARGFR